MGHVGGGWGTVGVGSCRGWVVPCWGGMGWVM